MAPTESVAAASRAPGAGIGALRPAIHLALLARLWRQSGAEGWGLALDDCQRILLEVGTAANFGLAAGENATSRQQAAFFGSLCLPDLVLARACAQGHERAWQHFVGVYRQPLVRAAIAIAGNETLGRDLAGQLYAELYGLTTRDDGERRCPLATYRGRGSLMAWLRTTLAQRHVDHRRRTRREEPLDDRDTDLDPPAPDPADEAPPATLSLLERAIEGALRLRDDEERFLLAAYYLDGRTLLEIARILGVHEATVSRKLQRATAGIRKQILRNLEQTGLSRRAAEEAMGADPRDLDLNLKKLLQNSQREAFQEQAAM